MGSITKDDVREYAATYTDFGFEMKALRAFRLNDWEVEHSGTYVDPISKKNREFDLRASKKTTNFPFTFMLAIECKNIDPSFPLVVQTVQRIEKEAFHEVIHYSRNGGQPDVARVTFNSRYQVGDFDLVAKSFDQIGKDKHGKLISSDGKTFDKMSQAINSAETLIQRCTPSHPVDQNIRYIVIPVLVIPDECLWRLRYLENGEPVGEPQLVPRAEYFINQSWLFEYNSKEVIYTMSHLEIVTLSAISEFSESLITAQNQSQSEKAFRYES